MHGEEVQTYRTHRQLISKLTKAQNLIMEARESLLQIQELNIPTNHELDVANAIEGLTGIIGDKVASNDNGFLNLGEILELESNDR